MVEVAAGVALEEAAREVTAEGVAEVAGGAAELGAASVQIGADEEA
jgi:hypothetical protein